MLQNEHSKTVLDNTYYVYALVDPFNKLPFYIGKGKGKRALSHLKEIQSNTLNKRKLDYISMLRNIGKEPLIIILFEFKDEALAYLKEKQLIKSYGRKDIDEDGILTNICVDRKPPNPKGLKRSEEVKQKMSLVKKEWHKDNPSIKFSDYSKNKMSESHKGGRISYYKKYGKEEGDRRWQERSKKVGDSRKGIKRSEEVKEKLRLSHKGKTNVGTKFVYNINSGLTKRVHKDDLEAFLLLNKDWKSGRKL